MDTIFTLLSPQIFIIAITIALFAGIVKGMVGFALPMILISTLSTIMPPELALAGVLAPTIVANGMQVIRYGAREVWETMKRFRVFLSIGAVMIFFSAQLVPLLPTEVFIMTLGFAVTGFALWQLTGFAPEPGAWGQSKALDLGFGGFAGLIGGLSGMWGPPTVTYLTAIGTEKRQQMAAQGVIYGMGAVVLVFAHLKSGVLNAQTLPWTLSLLPTAMIGVWIGGRISDRFDQATFRKATLLVLILGGLNLLRRGFLG